MVVVDEHSIADAQRLCSGAMDRADACGDEPRQIDRERAHAASLRPMREFLHDVAMMNLPK